MRLPHLLLAPLVVPGLLAAQPTGASRFLGEWRGTLQVGPNALRLGLTVEGDSSGGLRGSMVSLDQGNARMAGTLTVRGDTLVVAITAASATYTATLDASRDTLRGTFVQGAALPLVMTRGAATALAPARRPQDPKPPFPYRSLDVSFASVPNVTLGGSLTVPDGPGPFPAVVLVTGSGPQDRDETLMNHRPFRVIADHLARHGIATLRYDDRGVGQSTGRFDAATSADFSLDAAAAVRFLRTRAEIAHDRVGVMGHSEGGLIAPMVAARSRDVAFIVLLAGPGVPGDSILMLQNRALAAAAGVPAAAIDRDLAMKRRLFTAVRDARDSADAVARLRAVEENVMASVPADQRGAVDAQFTPAVAQLSAPWMRYFLVADPRPTLRKVRVPVLALNGTLDLQVPYKENLAAIDSALTAGGNRDHTIIALPNLNHLFQHARTGLVNEYGAIEETFAPEALDAITEWITKRFVRR